MTDEAAIAYLRHRRATYFFGDTGPPLPAGTTARWRLSLGDPRGWHANMVGFVEGPDDRLGEVLDTAIDWFTNYGADTWVDSDEFGPLFQHPDLTQRRGFRLIDDWDAMLCRTLARPKQRRGIELEFVRDEQALRTAALIAEQSDHRDRSRLDQAAVERRLARFRGEFAEQHSRFLLATLDDQPVGTARLTTEELPVIVGVVTLPAARNRGVATAITVRLVEAALAERGACALYAERGSQAARIYSRLGFKPIFRTRAWRRPLERSA